MQGPSHNLLTNRWMQQDPERGCPRPPLLSQGRHHRHGYLHRPWPTLPTVLRQARGTGDEGAQGHSTSSQLKGTLCPSLLPLQADGRAWLFLLSALGSVLLSSKPSVRAAPVESAREQERATVH